jgi:expansin (peptidoglycan-binding protein)
MEEKLYYWILFANTVDSNDSMYWNETVVDIHPFTVAKMLHKQLISWKTIDKKEYDLWKQLNNKKDEIYGFED